MPILEVTDPQQISDAVNSGKKLVAMLWVDPPVTMGPDALDITIPSVTLVDMYDKIESLNTNDHSVTYTMTLQEFDMVIYVYLHYK